MDASHIPSLCRHNPAVFLRILTLPRVGERRRTQYVLKLAPATEQFRREGAMYAALAGDASVVACAFAGPVSLAAGRGAPDIVVEGEPLPLPREVVAGARRHFAGVPAPVDDLYAVVTRYDARALSLPCHLSAGRPVPSNFTTRALRVLERMARQHRFVHWDMHSHNMLVDSRTGSPVLLDLDLASVAGDLGPVARILPVHAYLGLLREIEGDAGLTAYDLGHSYDVAMLLTAHRHSLGTVHISRTTRVGRRAWDVYLRFRRAYRLQRRIDWLALGRALLAPSHGGDGAACAARADEIEGHLRLLFLATAMHALSREGVDDARVLAVARSRFAPEESVGVGSKKDPPCAASNADGQEAPRDPGGAATE